MLLHMQSCCFAYYTQPIALEVLVAVAVVVARALYLLLLG